MIKIDPAKPGATDSKAPKTTRSGYPQIPDRLAILYVAVTMLIMAYSYLFKIFPIMIFLGLWFSHVYYKKTFILRPTGDLVIALLFPFLCCYSAFWSDYPAESAYAGFGLGIMVACTIIISRTVRVEAFVKGITLGTLLVLLLTLISGRYTRDYFTHKYSLTGLFGSKNEVGFFAEVGLYASALLIFAKIKIRDKLFFSFMPFCVSLISLYLCKSASSVLSLAIASGVSFGMYLITRLPRRSRLLAIAFAAFAVLTLAVVAIATDADIFKPVLKSFGKDSTLTGRTYLWSEGIKNGLKRPILGYGYYAFWRPGRPEAEKYWHQFEISGKTGFHFHNLFIQTFVDLGIVGLFFMISLILISCVKSIRRILRDGMTLEGAMALGFSFLFFMRAFVEVDLFGPFGIGPLLYYSIIPRLARRETSDTPEPERS